MRRVYVLTILLALAAGSMCADPTVSLSCTGLTGLSASIVGGDGCFQTSFINANALDSLDWGAPYAASGQSGLGAAVAGSNYFGLSTSSILANRTATTDNETIGIELAPGYTGGATGVTRVDDLAQVYEGLPNGWVSALFTNVAFFPGHFNSNSVASTTVPDGDALLEDASGAPLELSFLGQANSPVLGIWFQIAALSGDNSTFEAQVQAFDKNGILIGTYRLSEGGSYGTGGTCDSLSIVGAPIPCDVSGTNVGDTPYVGFYDPQGRINSIYISAFNSSDTNFTTPIGFAIDSLMIEEAPEPAVPLLIGGGLAAMALYRRRRRAQVA